MAKYEGLRVCMHACMSTLICAVMWCGVCVCESECET